MAQLQAEHVLVFDSELFGGVLQTQLDTMAHKPGEQLIGIEPTERHGGQLDFEAAPVPQKAVAEHLAGVTQANAFRRFIECADEHQSPKPLDGAARLKMPVQPLLKRRVGIVRRPVQTRQPPGDTNLFKGRQVVRSQEAPGQVEWGGPRVGAEPAAASIGGHENQGGLRLEQMSDAERAKEMCQVRAATHADVLAGIDELAGDRGLKGTGPTAQPATRFKQGDSKAARARAVAAASPANPPPMITTRSDIHAPALAAQVRMYSMLARAIVTGSGA